jgi:hypothetical protein
LHSPEGDEQQHENQRRNRRSDDAEASHRLLLVLELPIPTEIVPGL